MLTKLTNEHRQTCDIRKANSSRLIFQRHYKKTKGTSQICS